MSSLRIIGLESIRIGAIGGAKAMGTTLVTVNAIVPDSAHLIFETPGVTDLYVEDEDLPDIQIIGPAKRTIEFATRDMATGIMIEAFGGSASGTAWTASTSGSIVAKERCIEAKSKTFGGKYFKIELPRVNVRNGGDLRFAKTESGQMSWICDVLFPATTPQTAPMVITSI